jgi:anthranilate synthase
MIRVERSEAPAPPGAAEVFLATLDTQHGAWLGCDVEAEGLYERRSMGCADPSLSFFLDGNELRVFALSPVGHALMEHVRPLATFEQLQGALVVRFEATQSSPHPVVRLLRAFLALFDSSHPELALFGAFSFDYGRLASGSALPSDGKRRMALYFSPRVLVAGAGGAKWVTFRFPELKSTQVDRPAVLEPVRFERDADDLPPGGHASRVRQGVESLREGGIYSLVLSQTFRRRVSVKSSAAFDALRRLNPYPAMFFLNLGGGETLFGASPDVQVRADADYVESAPVCGTYRRGADAIADADQALALLNSAKEDAALAACADSDRNDKATVCAPGSLELVSRRRVHFFSTIIHTIDHTRGRRRQGADVFDILLAHASPATVTGMPKPVAMRAIEAIESSWRGWYAGAVARLGTDGSMEAFTVLRAARVAGGVAEVRTGGNLLVDSDPEKEEEETRLKAETLFRVLGGESPRPPVRTETFGRHFGVSYFDGGDPLSPLLLDCLASIGCEVLRDQDGGIALLGDGKHEQMGQWSNGARPLLAIGSGALALIEAQGGRLTTLSEPRYARRISAQTPETGFLAGRGILELGMYTRQVIDVSDLPANWQAAAVTPQGWVLAASSINRPQVAILCRPDSVQSMKGEAGRHLLRAALAWLTDRRA